MIDEESEWLFDRGYHFFARLYAPWRYRLRKGIGFRAALITSRIARSVEKLMEKMRKEEGGDLLPKDAPVAAQEPDDDLLPEGAAQMSALKRRAARQNELNYFLDTISESGLTAQKGPNLGMMMVRFLMRADALFVNRQLVFSLLMTMVTACMLAARTTGALAAMAAFFALHFLAAAMDETYEPICADIRQRYLASQFLRAGAFAALLARWFMEYARWGVSSNIVLQCAMVFTLLLHGLLFVIFVAFNGRQKPFARILAGLLGCLPALTCAAGIALSMSTISGGIVMLVGGIVRAVGAALAFWAWESEMLTDLGANPLVFGRLMRNTMMISGFFMMLAGTVMTTP